jgi:RNA polymerase sigma-70 factor (ECF subfamily)
VATAGTETETSLVERARAGDRAAFGELFAQNERPLAAFARRRLRPDEDASDVAQAVLARALEEIGSLRDPAAWRGWLYGIALNECRRRNRQRGRLRRALAALEELVLARGPSGLEADETDKVRLAVAKLPERQRLTVELRVWEGLSVADAALALGCTEGTVKANFHHALQRLRRELEER